MNSFKSKYIVIGVIVVALFIAGYFIYSNLGKKTIDISGQKASKNQGSQTSTTPQIVDKQASFAIFTNGTFRVFTATMYHNLSPDVFIEASSQNVIQIKKDGSTWNDFFSTLPFKLTRECLTTVTRQTFCNGLNGTLKFYINGIRNDDALSNKINHGDKMLITYGNEIKEQIQKQLDRLNSL